MTLAAIYARFSSDNQREESVEIQVERCSQLIINNNWVVGEVYADYAMTGTNDNRPAFQRCITDAKAKLFDVLVIYKHDRFARNVELSLKYKRQLKDAGVRIVSVREGESKDTPDGFLHDTLDATFAEYYSRNLSVLIRDGINKNAHNCKASGIRIFGYDVDATDHFTINETQAAIVREIFANYAGGMTVNQLFAWLKNIGCTTKRGKPWSKNGIIKLLKNPSYIGTYHYAGYTKEGGMPAIVERGLFEKVQDVMKNRNSYKRECTNENYLLTEKLYCLNCGRSLCGTSGTGKSGRKYCYYACQSKAGNCGLRLPAQKLEDAVNKATKELINDDTNINAMVDTVMQYAASKPSKEPMYKAELKKVTSKRNKLANSIANGVDPLAVKDSINACQARISELDRLIAREQFDQTQLLDASQVRSYIEKFVDKADTNPTRAQLLVDTFITKVYANAECAVIIFALDKTDVTLDQAQELSSLKTLDKTKEGVRVKKKWWSQVPATRTLYTHANTFATVVMRLIKSNS